jgi:hypothetical protein
MSTSTATQALLLDNPFLRRSPLYKACKFSLSLPLSTKKDLARHVTDHLFDLVLHWLDGCGIYVPSSKFSDQQKRMIRFMGDRPPSPCRPIGLVQEYLSHLLFQKTIDKSIYNYNNYQSRKCKTQPPHVISPCKSLPVEDDSPLDFSNCDDNHFPSCSPSPFIPKDDPDPITMPYASTTTRILPNPAPTTPVRTSCPKHCHLSCNISCLICTFFDYHHPSPV